ncbi:MAG: D-glycerate dehydrogenase [Betaproteobacteria bacterium]|nr:D-glycerate dehydrogenase [Betaproteobacteria bacterium]
MKKRILVSRQVFPEVVAKLAQQFDVDHNAADDILPPEQLRLRAHDCAGLLCCLTEKIDAAFFEACPGIRAVCNIAVGYNNIDVAEASRRGVMITNTPGVLDDTTADLSFALLMAAARRVTECERRLRNGEWKKGFALQQWLGTDIHHASLGIIGMGRIGQAIARRAQGFDMNVGYYNRTRLAVADETRLNVRYLGKEELLAQSDFVLVMVPYSPATHHLIGAAELAQMKPSAILINPARGGVVDDAALLVALAEKRIAGAALDVFENEPALRQGFLALDNVVLTPHIGSATRATRLNMATLAADNLVAALSGGTPPNLVNP